MMETRATSALMREPMKQMTAKRMFVGLLGPRRKEIRERKIRTKKPRIGGITKAYDVRR
jgi:hypothetical protein